MTAHIVDPTRYSLPNCIEFWPQDTTRWVGSPVVWCGRMWDFQVAGTPLSLGTQMFWEAWVKPWGGGKPFAGGYGGGHPVMLGSYDLGNGMFAPAGEIYVSTDAAVTETPGSVGAVAGQWQHWGLLLDTDPDSHIWLYVMCQGVAVGRNYIGNVGSVQRSTNPHDGGTDLWIGASADHATFAGRVAAVCGFDTVSPFNGQRFIPYIPRRSFGAWYDGGPIEADFLMTFDQPTGTPEDKSRGYAMGNPSYTVNDTGAQPRTLYPERRRHSGQLKVYTPATAPPSYVYDPYSPYGQLGDVVDPFANTWNLAQPTLATPSASPLIVDGFERPDSTWAQYQSSGPSLGATRVDGSRGSLTWTTGESQVGTSYPAYILNDGTARAKSFGILKRRAVCFDGFDRTALVDSGTANHVVQIERDPSGSGTGGVFGPGVTGIMVRGQDVQNGIVVWSWLEEGAYAGSALILTDVLVGGSRTNSLNYTANYTWKYLRVICNSGGVTNNIMVQIDNGSGGWTTLGTRSIATYNTATKVGLWKGGSYGAYGSSAWHAKNFVCWSQSSYPTTTIY